MKAAHVAQLVDACANAAHARDKADTVVNDTTAHSLRIEALEALVVTMADIMLAGTSADPEAPPAPKPAQKAKRK